MTVLRSCAAAWRVSAMRLRTAEQRCHGDDARRARTVFSSVGKATEEKPLGGRSENTSSACPALRRGRHEGFAHQRSGGRPAAAALRSALRAARRSATLATRGARAHRTAPAAPRRAGVARLGAGIKRHTAHASARAGRRRQRARHARGASSCRTHLRRSGVPSSAAPWSSRLAGPGAGEARAAAAGAARRERAPASPAAVAAAPAAGCVHFSAMARAGSSGPRIPAAQPTSAHGGAAATRDPALLPTGVCGAAATHTRTSPAACPIRRASGGAARRGPPARRSPPLHVPAADSRSSRVPRRLPRARRCAARCAPRAHAIVPCVHTPAFRSTRRRCPCAAAVCSPRRPPTSRPSPPPLPALSAARGPARACPARGRRRGRAWRARRRAARCAGCAQSHPPTAPGTPPPWRRSAR